MIELTVTIILTVLVLAFVAEYVDATLGMGYGTSLTPILLLIGFTPLQIVPAILFSQAVAGLFAAFSHHRVGNVDMQPKTTSIPKMIQAVKRHGVKKSLSIGLTRPLKIALILTVCGFIGSILAVVLAVNLPKEYLTTYIGLTITAVGAFILITKNRKIKFTWLKVGILGMTASFNKGISGGGYGPLITGGQVVSGVNGKNAIAITALAEGLTSIVGFTAYVLLTDSLDLSLLPILLVGSLLSVPLSAHTVKRIKTKTIKSAIGIMTIIMGLLTLFGID